MERAYTGSILHIDLTKGRHVKKPLNFKYARRYVGAKGLGARYLFDLLKPGTNPLDPGNVLIIMTGPLTGTIAPCSSRYIIATKSPLTNLFLDSSAGGAFGAEVKYAGWDGIIITGRSENPVYIYIKDDSVEIKNAEHLWGKDTHETTSAIKEELTPASKVMCIGPAGEKCVKFACTVSEYHRIHGRGGSGAVLGSKNLKAVVVQGSGCVSVAHPKEFLEACAELVEEDIMTPASEGTRKYGTPQVIWMTQEIGALPTRNWTDGRFESASAIDPDALLKMKVQKRPCFSCPSGCGNLTTVSSGPYAGVQVKGPEYETLALVGANCGVDRLDAIIKVNDICNRLGIDTISVGNVVAWAMECYERGVISLEDTDGIDLRFGNYEALITMVEKICKREGLGNILAEGVMKAAEKVGKGSERYAVHVKGLEPPGYDPRSSPAMGLSFAVADRGACHLRSWPIGAECCNTWWLSVEPFKIKRWSPEGKAKLVVGQENFYAAKFSLSFCDMYSESVERLKNLLWTATGFNEYKSAKSFLLAGERIVNLARIINLREGMTKEDDMLPPRFFEDPLKTGPAAGRVLRIEDFNKMLTDYYRLRGYDEDGRPTLRKLRELGMDDVISSLTRLGFR